MIEVRVPDEQEGTKAVVRAWLKKIGDSVAKNDPLVELETDKVTQEVPSPAAGVLAEILLDTDAEAIPGALLAWIETDERKISTIAFQPAKEPVSSQLESEEPPAERSGADAFTETRLSPSVRRACLQHGIDPERIEGTGRNGRVTREDVGRAVASATFVRVEPVASEPRTSGLTDIPHDRMRLTIAENMVRAISEAPHVTAVFEADF